ncbi:GntR family transcriptional regulator [Glaciihabitans tibetensis]|uniref:GntR family transcriptional regulator n=1 Tax=Glaciihabitans tibetensis TaxID=1266600 RepID=A0A2T0V726_9MICO|nr:FadR/GntR family transcriptional regulator [Glaciihabitans tibetensis]PRY65858.1 GntR family transcriptional regulator [Glaciihabitans tibetensis]
MVNSTGYGVHTERGLHAQVLTAVGEDIVDGRYPVGSVLNQDDLIARFSVSRSVLREALRVLQSLGMVEPRQRVGTQVLPRQSWNLMDPQLISWRGHGSEYFVQQRELIELRLGIEPVAARLCAERATAEELTAISAAAAEMADANDRGDERGFLQADVAFHALILRSSGNAVMGHFSGTVEALLRTRLRETRGTITEYTPSSAHRHNELAAALGRRDPEAAYQWSFSLLAATLEEFTAQG